LPSQRNERAVLKNVEVENVDVDDEDSFIERVRRLDCKQDVEKLIVDILDGPLRQRNALLVIYLPCSLNRNYKADSFWKLANINILLI
jgi:hypothetical protein